MNLLILSNNPDRASFRQRIGIYVGALQASGINCEVVRLRPQLLARRRVFARGAGFDGVFLHKKRLNSLDAFLARKYSKKVIYDFDDAVMCNDKHPERPSHKRLKSFQRTVRLADVVIAGNSYLAEHARRFNRNVEILPTGLDTAAYNIQASPTKDGKIRLVWIGSKTTLRYLAQIKPALEEVGSSFDNVVLRIICDDFLELRNMQVEERPWALDEQAGELCASDIGLAPLPDDSFTRGKCGFKVLQYAAAGLPVVASPIGANSDYVHENVTGFLATRTEEWVDKITRLIKNPQLRNKMGQEARNKVPEFDARLLGKRLLHIIVKSLGTSASAGR